MATIDGDYGNRKIDLAAEERTEEMIRWRNVIVVIVTAMIAGGIGLFLQSPKEQTIVKVADIPLTPKAKEILPTDWDTCIVASSVPDNKELILTTILQNRCKIPMQAFHIRLKLYDVTDARIGWLTDDIGILDPGEKVKYVQKYPVEDNPQVKGGVYKVQVAEFWGDKLKIDDKHF